jgi:predicted short-subunit dehydrogenase-like oxidoreductase (DUF2520 family)
VINACEREDSPRVGLAVEDGFVVLPAAHMDVNVDVLFFAVPDSEVASAAIKAAELSADHAGERMSRLERAQDGTETPAVAAHMSGRLGLEPLAPLATRGYSRLAIHPMQSFPLDANADRFKGITVGVTCDPSAKSVATLLAESLGSVVMEVEEEERVRYHLASVLVSNFLPLLLDLGAESLRGIADNRQRAVEALWPLMAGMLDSLRSQPPEAAMTGPVVRGDLDAVRAHGDSLMPDERELYFAMTRALVALAQRGGHMDEMTGKEWVNVLGAGNGRDKDRK